MALPTTRFRNRRRLLAAASTRLNRDASAAQQVPVAHQLTRRTQIVTPEPRTRGPLR